MMKPHERERLCFVVRKPHLDPLFRVLSDSYELHAVENKAFNFPKLDGMTIRKIHYFLFGIGTVLAHLRLETQPPIYIPGLHTHLKQIRPDVIIVFDFYHFYFLQCLRYARKYGSRVYVYSETKAWPQSYLSRLALRFFLSYLKHRQQLVQGIWVYSQQGYDFLRENLPHADIRILPAPVDTEQFFPDHAKRYMEHGVLRILMNARFVPYKRHYDLLDAAELLVQKGFAVHVSFIGRGGAGAKKLAGTIALRNMREYAKVLPAVTGDKMRSCYLAHDVLILPSYNEALGMVVPEAMACGIPTITSDTVGANVYVEEGKTGFVYPTGDVEALAASIMSLVSQEKLETMGAAARRVIGERFSLTKGSEAFAAALGHHHGRTGIT